MKAILIKGAEMPEERGFIDLRVYGDGTVISPCGSSFSETKAVEIEIPDNE